MRAAGLGVADAEEEWDGNDGKMKIGKLDNALLRKIVIDKIGYRRSEVITGPGIGEDCAVIDFGAYECILSTDPITAAGDRIGSLAVHVSCNDIASNGVEPLGVMLTVLLPPDTTEQEIETIMAQAAETAKQLGVEIIGGHTEITDAVTKPIVSSTAVGRGVAKSGFAESDAISGAGGGGRAQSGTRIRPGDRILVTKKLAMEGTGIIASDHAETLAGVLTAEELRHAVSMLDRISVVKEGVLAGSIGTTGMHDVTEGGVLGAVWELCRLADAGAEIWREAIPLDPVTVKICGHFGLDPLRLISSGSMLIVAHPKEGGDILQALRAAGTEVTEIGLVKEREEGLRLVSGAIRLPIEAPQSDEIYKMIGAYPANPVPGDGEPRG
ncbi:MAG: AIR synthase family protein [Clostridiales Family XIII bacterium]|jgi:hydrogenase expression/formation protein HypE|nr:AIR synthase family protein [Clostridiales Family XIII bacterium]